MRTNSREIGEIINSAQDSAGLAYEIAVISSKQEPQGEEKNMIPNQIRSAQSVQFLEDPEFCDEIPEKINVKKIIL